MSPYGIRALSRFHAEHPYVFNVNGQEYRVNYLPAESDTGMFCGNSNWRGPVWMPVNALPIRALLSFYLYYGDNFKIECLTGSGNEINLFQVAREIANRLTRIFLRDNTGRGPDYGGSEKFQTDPHWKDYVLFYEYFHGDNGAGLGASHQSGWTGMVAKLIDCLAALMPTSTVRLANHRRLRRRREPSNLRDQRIDTPYLDVPPQKVVAIVLTDSPDRNSACKPPDKSSKLIAGHILEFVSWEVPKGRMPANLFPLQSGVGNIANAVLFWLGFQLRAFCILNPIARFLVTHPTWEPICVEALVRICPGDHQ